MRGNKLVRNGEIARGIQEPKPSWQVTLARSRSMPHLICRQSGGRRGRAPQQLALAVIQAAELAVVLKPVFAREDEQLLEHRVEDLNLGEMPCSSNTCACDGQSMI